MRCMKVNNVAISWIPDLSRNIGMVTHIKSVFLLLVGVTWRIS
jgi:hypothetical protein